LSSDKKQEIYNWLGVLLVFLILLGTGILLVKTNGKDEEIRISQPVVTEVKGEETGVETRAGLVNINTADLSQLDTLPGIGPVTAQKILDYRTQNGQFKTIEEIMNVSGIGQAKFENMKDKISI
jgi:competence protein ComEA